MKMANQTESPTVANWLSRLSPSSHKGMRHHFSTWIKWMGENGGKFSKYTPENLVEFQKEAGNSERYEILDFIQIYIGGLEGRVSYKKTTYSNIRSFFRHNRCELPQDPTFTVRSEKPKIVGTLTVDEIKQVIMSSNPCYKAVYICMFQGGMSKGELIYWSNNGWDQLKQNLEGTPDTIRIDLPGRKKYANSRPYFTLVGGDSIEALRNWVKRRPEEASAIFTNQFGEGISKNSVSMYWNKHMKKLDLYKLRPELKHKVRYGKNLHEIRDVFRSQWEVSTAKASVAEFMMGHIVDKLGYNKAHRDVEWMKKEYRKALPLLQIMSSGTPFGLVGETQVEILQEKIRELESKLTKQSNIIAEQEKANAEMKQMKKDMAEMMNFMKEAKARAA